MATIRTGWVRVSMGVLAMVGALLGGVRPADAQAPGVPGGGMGYNAVVGRLFNDIPAFSANVDTVLTNTADKSRLSVPMRMMKREERLRIEVDFGKLTGDGVDLQGLASMRTIGMSRLDSVVSPSERVMYVLFPDLKFSSQVPLTEGDLPNAGFRVSKKALGRETIQGQACVRQRVTLTDAKGGKTEATVWEASALNGFPVRIFFQADGSAVVMTFTEVGLGAPPPDQFRVPAEYKTFESMTLLMREALDRGSKPGR